MNIKKENLIVYLSSHLLVPNAVDSTWTMSISSCLASPFSRSTKQSRQCNRILDIHIMFLCTHIFNQTNFTCIAKECCSGWCGPGSCCLRSFNNYSWQNSCWVNCQVKLKSVTIPKYLEVFDFLVFWLARWALNFWLSHIDNKVGVEYWNLATEFDSTTSHILCYNKGLLQWI